LIGRIHERAVFARLRRDGSFVRSGPLWCSVLLDPSLSQPHVAYALGRPVGSAVSRNRLRRRLREVVRANATALEPGWYLVGADAPAVDLTFTELNQQLPALAYRPSPCRFSPSCSNYAHEAFECHGTARGFWLTLRRLSRCRPFGPSGWDPVPEPGDVSPRRK
jgi:putative membrane protein insertion efficiency factor